MSERNKLATIVRTSLTSDKPVTTVLTDAQRQGDVHVHHHSVRVGAVIHHQVYAEYLSLAFPTVGLSLRRHLAVARWGGGAGGQPGPEDLRGFYFTPVRDRFIQQHQLSGLRVVGSHLDAGNPPLHRHCPVESEKIQAKPSDEKKGDSFEVIDLTDDTDDEVIDITDD